MFDISLNLIDSSTKLARSAKTPTKPKKVSIKLDSLKLKEKSSAFISDTSSEEDDEVPEWKKRLEDKLQKLKKRRLNGLEKEEEDKENCSATAIDRATTKKVEKTPGDSDSSLNLFLDASEMEKTPKSKEFVESSGEDSSEELSRETVADNKQVAEARNRKRKAKESDDGKAGATEGSAVEEKTDADDKEIAETRNRKRKAAESDDEKAETIPAESCTVEEKSIKKSVKRVKKKKSEEAKGDQPIIEEVDDDDDSAVGEEESNNGKKTAVKRKKLVKKKISTAKASSPDEEKEQVAPEADMSGDKEVDFEDGKKPGTSTKERAQNSSSGDEVAEARLARLRKYAHHAGLIPPYKKLFADVEKTSKKIKILSDFLLEKGIQKPLSMKTCAEYKIRRENERETEALSMNTIFEDVYGGRVTRSSRHNAVVKRLSRAAIEGSESESENDNNDGDDQKNTTENQSTFSGLAGIVSSDDED